MPRWREAELELEVSRAIDRLSIIRAGGAEYHERSRCLREAIEHCVIAVSINAQTVMED